MTAKSLAAELKLTTMGVRQHLQSMEAQAFVVCYDQKTQRGRPTRYWKLTTNSQSKFPDSHQELTLQLIDSIKVVFGEDGLDNLISQREKIASQHYHQVLANQTDLRGKVGALAELRSNEGYMAQVEFKDGCFWLMENHCPICAAASQCLQFCRSELHLFEELLSGLATITREEHIIEGARRCSYKIKPN